MKQKANNKTIMENILKVKVSEASERHELSVKHIMAHEENILKARLEIGNPY